MNVVRLLKTKRKQCPYLKSNEISIGVDLTEAVEDIWVNIQCRKLPSIIFGRIYRHPHAPSFTYISDCQRDFCIRKKSVIIVGILMIFFLAPDNKMHSRKEFAFHSGRR